MRMMFNYMKRYKHLVFIAMILKLAGTIIELLLPYVLEYLIDDVAPLKDVKLVVLGGLFMILLAIGARMGNVWANRTAIRGARNATYDIRRDLFWKTLNLSGNQVDEVGLPSLTSRMTSDSYNVQNFLQSFQTMGIRAPIMLIGGIAVTWTMDSGLASILLVMAPILLVIAIFVSKKGIPMFDRVQDSLDDIVRIMRENITGIRVVKALSKENYEMGRYNVANEEMTRRDRNASMVMALPGPFMQISLNIGLALVVVVGAQRVNAGIMQPGVILAFLTYFNMILMGVMSLNRIFMMFSKANASANRIARVINAEEDLKVVDEADAKQPKKEGYVVFDHVTFSYGAQLNENQLEHPSLSDLDFAIQKGGSLGIIGATGSGKTTIVNLLMRFYDATQGGVFIDGKDVRTYNLDELRRKFGVVFQNDVIFSDTLYENIEFGRDIDLDGVKEASRDAMAQEFIEAYDDQYQHKADIRGMNFSGGQKQRILIARALAAKPEILILDDSSSALDYKTDAALRKVIRENYKGTTTIVVAQRVSSIMSLDQIIMLDEGEVIGIGTHDELMKTCAPYREIYDTQMGEGGDSYAA